MLSVNDSMQFNHLHWNSTTTIVSKCWSQPDRWIIIVLLFYIYEQLQAPNNERNSLIISLYGISLHSFNKSNHNSTPLILIFSPTQKSVTTVLPQ